MYAHSSYDEQQEEVDEHIDSRMGVKATELLDSRLSPLIKLLVIHCVSLPPFLPVIMKEVTNIFSHYMIEIVSRKISRAVNGTFFAYLIRYNSRIG